MEAKSKNLSIRHSYNLASMSFSPAELAEEIKKHLPDFTINYEPDFRQEIAESWTQSIDDSMARKDWGWKDQYNLQSLTSDMLHHLRKR
jgi:nucleoside-diphosphate-sugar epimerase